MLYSHISDLSLPSEIILAIIEAMEYDSTLFVKLMCISKVSTRKAFPCVTKTTRSFIRWFSQLAIYDFSILEQISDFERPGVQTKC